MAISKPCLIHVTRLSLTHGDDYTFQTLSILAHLRTELSRHVKDSVQKPSVVVPMQMPLIPHSTSGIGPHGDLEDNILDNSMRRNSARERLIYLSKITQQGESTTN